MSAISPVTLQVDTLTATTITQDSFTAPTLLNGWSNYGGTQSVVGYYKGRDGVVRIKGTIAGGTTTANTVLFTLPSGYRPDKDLIFPVFKNSSIGFVAVLLGGNVILQTSGDSTIMSLDGIAFKV